ncbi:hypothetical protein F511_46149 [Dorcoceras hygrometricum]|uniref:Uncharacterized protein n=1 Tax=Dorcoceras hygrometricum TaxID=472368 RepID=A0A2Z6ZU95_9LAMI|nr:hypothetical protein F511_46149 [Dorcoceras hygrometricum]
MMSAASRASSHAAAHMMRYWTPAAASWMRCLVDIVRAALRYVAHDGAYAAAAFCGGGATVAVRRCSGEFPAMS